MSIGTPAPTTPAATDRTPGPDGSSRLIRFLPHAAIVVGAVIAGTGMGLHIGATPEDERLAIAIAEDPLWLTTHLLLGFGFALLAFGLASSLFLLRGRGAQLTGIGAVVGALGALVMSFSDLTHGAVGFALGTHVSPATSLQIHTAYFEHPAILGMNTGPLLLPLGMILLGAGLLRSRAVPRWMPVVVMLCPLAIHASFAVGLPPVVNGLLLAAGMSVFAYALRSLRPDTAPRRSAELQAPAGAS
jgi:hypothetical protein